MPKREYVYKVSGTGYFPTMMLEYDKAIATHIGYADLIDEHTRKPGEKLKVEIFNSSYVVELVSKYPPTIDRWKSFGWTVTN